MTHVDDDTASAMLLLTVIALAIYFGWLVGRAGVVCP
jgi:hypothetical protein